MADKKEIAKMLHEELSKKVDSETMGKLKNAKSSSEALSILEDASISLDENVLAAVSGGDEENDLDMIWNCHELCWERTVCIGDSCSIVVCTRDKD